MSPHFGLLDAEKMDRAEAARFVERVEGVLTRIGILPIVEATLPPENPQTD